MNRIPVFRGTTRIPGLYERQLKDGTTVYEVVARIDGKVTTQRLDATQKQAAINEAGRLMSGTVPARSNGATVADLAETYLSDLEWRVASSDPQRHRSPNTLAAAQLAIRKHIIPLIGDTEAAALDVSDVRRFVVALKMKPSSARRVLAVLSAILRLGMKDKVISRNVAGDLDRDDRPSAKRERQPRYLSLEELEQLLGSLNSNYRGVAAACAFAGLRVSEALALRWSDVDFTAGTLTVRESKTTAGCATVPLLPRLRRELLELRGDVVPFPSTLIFATVDGRALHRRNVLRAIKREGGCTVHDLRHSFVSLALSAGVPVHEVSKLARHASPAVTMSVYAGLADSGLQSAAERLARNGFG